jgi:cytochrome P450
MSGDEVTGPQARAEADALFDQLAVPGGCPDPYPAYARLLALGRVHRGAAGTLFATGYDECAAVTRDTVFRAQTPQWCDTAMPGWRERPALVATFEAMLFRDPPDHTRLRHLVSAAFTPRQADRMRADVTRLTDKTLDMLADAGADGSPVDLQQVLAASLPIEVIGSLVGVPEADRQRLRAAMSALLRVVELSVSQRERDEADLAAIELRDYFGWLAASRRAAPEDDLVSELAARTHDDDGLTEDELLQTLTFVFMAGVDTMINLLANGTAALLAHPGQADLLRASPALGPRAAEEVLRFDPPVQFLGRVTAADTVIGGVPAPAGSLVVAMLGAANRDPARFGAPGTFDIGRTGTAVLSFGGGIHFCLGAPLARVEAGAFFPALLTRFPGLRHAGQPRRSGAVFRGFSHLPVTLT